MVKIFSIKEEYTDKIYSKKKHLELRRQNVNIEINEICLIYTTNPVKSVTGYFVVKKKLRLPIKKLWEVTKDKSGVSKEKFFDYFKNCSIGTAIVFKKVGKFSKGVSLQKIKNHQKNFYPPQSYFHLNIAIIKVIANEIEDFPDEIKSNYSQKNLIFN